MGHIRSEEEVDALIEEMLTKGKGKYVTQGVAFNKDNPRQMELLKKTLMSSSSFGGFVKDMLATHFNRGEEQYGFPPANYNQANPPTKKRDIGNFLSE